MNKIISIVGIVLITAAGVLTALSASKEDVIKSKKILCEKYTKNAEVALQQKDFDKAFKFAKLAIKVDPENKLGYKVLEKIMNAKCAVNTPTSNKATNQTNTKAPLKPAKPAAEEEEEMGC